MKKILFVCLMSLIWGLGMMVSEAKAQTVYSYTDVHYSTSGRYVDGYSNTHLDYWAGLDYDPKVLGELYRTDMNENPLDSDEERGYADLIDAEVYLFSTNYVEGKTYCTSGIHSVVDYRTGYQTVVARLYPCITIAFSPTPTPTPPPTPPPTPTPNPVVTGVSFERLQGDSMRIDSNPNIGDGRRVFPDDEFPGDTAERQTIRVTATVSQQRAGINVYFRNFDVDDPETDMTIDPNGNAGDDNNGTPIAGQLQIPNGCGVTRGTIYCPTDASGVATIEFTVTRQPGDNFAIAAGTNPNEVNAVNVSGTDLVNGSGQTIPTTCGLTEPVCRSQMLTVWRRLHIEVDSMGESQQNFVLGTTTETVRLRAGQQATIPVTMSNGQRLEINRFENGRIVINSRSYTIISNEEYTVDILGPGAFTTIFAGSMVQLFDDDDFNNNDGTNVDGDTGEDITDLTAAFYNQMILLVAIPL